MDQSSDSYGQTTHMFVGIDARVRAFLGQSFSNDHPAIRKVSYRKGQLLAHEGDDSADVWYLLKGKVQVFRTTANGRLVTLATLNEGDFAGEMAVIEEKERSACILALHTVEAFLIPSAVYRSWLSSEVTILQALIVQLSERVRNAGQQTVEIAGGSVSQRLAAQLVRLGQRDADGSIILAPCPKVTDLAKMVNATREAVSKIFNQWLADDHLTRVENGLRVNALPALAAI